MIQQPAEREESKQLGSGRSVRSRWASRFGCSGWLLLIGLTILDITGLVDAFGSGGNGLVKAISIFGALIVGLFVFAAFAQMSKSKQQDMGYERLKPTIDSHMGRHADYHSLLKSGWAFLAYVPEQCFYFHDASEPFDPKRLYGPGEVRGWHVEWSDKVKHGSRESTAVRDDYCLVAELQSTESPLLKLPCEDEAMAYQVKAVFHEMFEGAR